MLLLARNYDLIRDREKTFLTASVAATGTTITVRAVEVNAWADDDYIIVGEIGTDTAEVLQINGVVSNGTSLTIDNNGSGGARYAHSADEPVYKIDFNQVEFNRSATDDTSGVSVLATNDLQPDDEFTRFEDTNNSTGFAFTRFKNETTSVFSEYSDGIPYTGYPARSVGRMMKMVRRQLGDPDIRLIDDDDILEEFNEKQRDVGHERLWPFYEDHFSASRVAEQRRYAIDSNAVIAKDHGVLVDSQPMAKVDSHRFDRLFWDTTTSGEPTIVQTWDNDLWFWPIPDTAATSTTLNGAISSATTTSGITLTSGSGFRSPGRLIIDDEVISYESINSSHVLAGVRRAQEQTTGATHSNAATVTERDIIYRAHVEPTELVDFNDQTAIPDPMVLVYGAAMELAISKLEDESKHDRLKLKYDEAIGRLRDKFTRKSTIQFQRIKDRNEVVTDTRNLVNPNDFPTNIGT